MNFPTAEHLKQHRVNYHKSENNSSMPFVIPIVDFTRPGAAARLQAMGVTSYLPVAQLDSQGGQFGVPIMSTARPNSVDGLRYTNFFNLGSIRKV